MCPGYIRTDLTKNDPDVFTKSKKTIEEGIATPMFLIEKEFNYAEQEQGQFFYESQVRSF